MEELSGSFEIAIDCHKHGLFAHLPESGLPIRIKYNCFENAPTPHVVAQPSAKTTPNPKKLNFRAMLG